MTRPWVLIDRDGTLIVERHYLCDPDKVELIAGAGPALRRLRLLGCGLAVVTNQSGVGRGMFTLAQMQAVHRRMEELLAAEGASLDAIFYCPHAPEVDCACRKPRVGMAQQAAERFNIELHSAFVVGDKDVDIELGKNCGATSLLVRTGYGAKHEVLPGLAADYVVDDLPAAAREIERLIAAR